MFLTESGAARSLPTIVSLQIFSQWPSGSLRNCSTSSVPSVTFHFLVLSIPCQVLLSSTLLPTLLPTLLHSRAVT
ncbi:hypothetical protein H9L39_17716 [Fusarium oxysporum f. sp. albedinis]|nr:hypothetical protein H9L39_17716 [Fusarium oxysporum f. sp. albedinis]